MNYRLAGTLYFLVSFLPSFFLSAFLIYLFEPSFGPNNSLFLSSVFFAIFVFFFSFFSSWWISDKVKEKDREGVSSFAKKIFKEFVLILVLWGALGADRQVLAVSLALLLSFAFFFYNAKNI